MPVASIRLRCQRGWEYSLLEAFPLCFFRAISQDVQDILRYLVIGEVHDPFDTGETSGALPLREYELAFSIAGSPPWANIRSNWSKKLIICVNSDDGLKWTNDSKALAEGSVIEIEFEMICITSADFERIELRMNSHCAPSLKLVRQSWGNSGETMRTNISAVTVSEGSLAYCCTREPYFPAFEEIRVPTRWILAAVVILMTTGSRGA
jgi:hypothetical protein